MHSVIYTKRALKNLDDIYAFIAKDNIFFATKVIETIFSFASTHLSLFPLLWKESQYMELREIVEPTFK